MEQDPAATTYAVGDDRISRGIVVHHMRLPRAGWLASGSASQIQISGFGACRHLFGLTAS